MLIVNSKVDNVVPCVDSGSAVWIKGRVLSDGVQGNASEVIAGGSGVVSRAIGWAVVSSGGEDPGTAEDVVRRERPSRTGFKCLIDTASSIRGHASSYWPSRAEDPAD